MKKINLILGIFIFLITFSACNNEDEITLTAEELIIQNSPWQFEGVELVNIVNNGNADFDKQEWEENVNDSNQNISFIFLADGTVTSIEKNPPNPDKVMNWNWVIENGNQIKFYEDDSNDFDLFNDLKVTETHLEFIYIDFEVDDNVVAGLKYLFIK